MIQSCRFGLLGNTSVLINAVILRRARLVPGWVTVLGRVNHLGTEPGIQVYSAWAVRLWVDALSKQSRDALARIRGLTVWAGVWLRTSLREISADVREAVAH